MTKEALEEEAYQYDAEHLRGARGARWYHNVTIREAYLAGAEPREKRIKELENALTEQKQYNAFKCENNKKIIDNLEHKNAELKKRNGELTGQKASLERWLGEAKAIIKDIISSYGSTEVSEAQLYLKMKRAEQFLEGVKK